MQKFYAFSSASYPVSKGLVFLLLLSTSLFLSYATLAQGRGDQRINNNLNRLFKSSNKLAITGGAGLSIINSDYDTDRSNPLQLVRAKGIGGTAGVGALYQFAPHFAAEAQVGYVYLDGKQAGATESSRSFSSHLFTATGTVQAFLASKTTLMDYYDRTVGVGMVILPYVKGGLGLVSYKASSFVGSKEDAPLTTYPATAMVMPIGGGLRFKLSEQLTISPEATLFLTSTDFLDNRKMSESMLGANDKFASFCITFQYFLLSQKGRY